jgi:NADH dehydrogenase
MITMATISRFLVLMMLTGFKTRISILFNWTVAFLGRGRAQQVITAQKVLARRALDEHARESGTGLPIPMTAATVQRREF